MWEEQKRSRFQQLRQRQREGGLTEAEQAELALLVQELETAEATELTVDHFQPRSQGGLHEPENWVYCCHACNEFKRDSWQPNSPQRILHPLREDLAVHLVEREDGTLAKNQPNLLATVDRSGKSRVPFRLARSNARGEAEANYFQSAAPERIRAARTRVTYGIESTGR